VILFKHYYNNNFNNDNTKEYEYKVFIFEESKGVFIKEYVAQNKVQPYPIYPENNI
jgi:hypothetical protein